MLTARNIAAAHRFPRSGCTGARGRILRLGVVPGIPLQFIAALSAAGGVLCRFDSIAEG
ncbi:hypothetical protein [Geobacillus subterraneus]|uniref:hypothetical protein n=1 Tax=Geobacillus subterraneus TaxID=129338 RepID=UPI001610E2DA